VAESRESRRAILSTYVNGFLDHLEEDFPGDDVEMGSVVIAAEVTVDGETMVPTYYSSNENGIWRRGFFELLADYHRLSPTGLAAEEDDGD
jgi:hypothetical protein